MPYRKCGVSSCEDPTTGVLETVQAIPVKAVSMGSQRANPIFFPTNIAGISDRMYGIYSEHAMMSFPKLHKNGEAYIKEHQGDVELVGHELQRASHAGQLG